MSEKIFLITIPLTWYGKFKVLTAPKTKYFTTFLKTKDENNVPKIEATIYYAYGKVKSVDHTHSVYSIKEEYNDKRNYVSPEKYKEYLSNADQTKSRLTKTRYSLDFNHKYFHLDVYEDNLLGLAILNVREDLGYILLPPFFKVEKDISNDPFYSEFGISKIKRYVNYSNESFPRRID
jgi:hypothetical protein